MRYAPHPFKVGFRNKHTANRRRSPINKHLSKIIVFTIRQRKIIRPKTARINIYCILHPFRVQNHNYVNNTPIVLQPSSIAEKDSKHNNRPKKMYVSTSWKYYHSSRTSLLVEKNNVSPLKKTTTLFNPCQSFSTARFDDYFFSIKIIYAPTSTPIPFAP